MLAVALIATAGAASGCGGASDAIASRPGDRTPAQAADAPAARPGVPAVPPAPAGGLPRAVRVLPGGAALGIPLTPSEGAIKAGVASVKLGDTEVLAPISRVEPVADDPASSAAAADDAPAVRAARWWIGAGPAWRSAKGPGPGQWIAVLPASALDEDARPSSLLVDGRPVALDWRPPEPALVDALLDVAPELSPLLTRATDALMSSPEERWRAKLASGRPLGIDEDAPIADPAVAALARYEESRWLSALERLWRLDRELCLVLAARLRMVVDSADDAGWLGGPGGARAPGERVPLWPTERSALLALRERLADPRATDAALASAATALIAGQPPALAVVIDDAGTLADDRTPLPAVWAAALLPEPVAARVRAAGSPGGEELARLEPMTARRLYAAPPRASDEEAPGPLARPRLPGARPAGTQLRVSIGEWSATRSAVAALVPARPPGVTVGPMLLDWTMATLLEAGADPTGNAPLRRAAPGGALDLAGRLYREPGAGAAEGGDAAGRWTLYLECRRAPAPAPAAGRAAADTIRIHLGPAGTDGSDDRGGGNGGPRPRAAAAITLQVAADGALSIRTGDTWTDAGRVRVVAGQETIGPATRWSAWIPLPSAAIPADGILQLGLTRLATTALPGEGARSAWPRPMLPWSEDPARIAIDLKAWGGGGGADARDE